MTRLLCNNIFIAGSRTTVPRIHGSGPKVIHKHAHRQANMVILNSSETFQKFRTNSLQPPSSPFHQFVCHPHYPSHSLLLNHINFVKTVHEPADGVRANCGRWHNDTRGAVAVGNEMECFVHYCWTMDAASCRQFPHKQQKTDAYKTCWCTIYTRARYRNATHTHINNKLHTTSRLIF